MPSESRSVADFPRYETSYLRPDPQRDPNEIEFWLNNLHGRLVSVVNSPYDATSLIAVTQVWS